MTGNSETGGNGSDLNDSKRTTIVWTLLSLGAVSTLVGLAVGLTPPTVTPWLNGDRKPRPSGRADQATVVEIVDGDTIKLDFADDEQTVRLLGVDAPESVHPTLPKQCFGAEAADALAEAIPPGSSVRVERDAEARDRYGRLLLHVFRNEDDLHLNRWLIEQGLAEISFYEPNDSYRQLLTQARWRSTQNRRGLWAVCDGPDQPLDPVG